MLNVLFILQEDLLSFHVRRYGRALHDTHSISKPHRAVNQNDEATIDGDDLGYYPDGVRRTLTDQQVAIFRHSEIQSLLRAKRHQREMKSSESEVNPVGRDIESKGKDRESDQLPPAMMESSHSEFGKNSEDNKVMDVDEEDEEDDEEEYSRFLAAERQEFESATLAINSSRRGENFDRADRTTSTRRRVRELDAAESRDEVLDYGEERCMVSGPSKRNSDHMVNAKRVSPHADTLTTFVCMGNPETVNKLVEGRKIWWPTIGK